MLPITPFGIVACSILILGFVLFFALPTGTVVRVMNWVGGLFQRCFAWIARLF